MSPPATAIPLYRVSVHQPEGGGEVLQFTFPTPGRVPEHSVIVRATNDGLTFDWSATSDDHAANREGIQAEVAARMAERAGWIDRVNGLVGRVEQWARELGWATRRVDKHLDDLHIGRHCVPGLLMQEETCRILLEPIGRAAPGAEGVVDLYLLPAYDDLATLYHDGRQWNLHYRFPNSRPVATVREAEARPLSKEVLAETLAELRRRAA